MAYGRQAEAIAAVLRVDAAAAAALCDGVSADEALLLLLPGDVGAHTCAGRLGLQPVDAILRTGGELLTSGFAMWECGGAELTFAPDVWAAFRQASVLQCLLPVDLALRRQLQGL